MRIDRKQRFRCSTGPLGKITRSPCFANKLLTKEQAVRASKTPMAKARYRRRQQQQQQRQQQRTTTATTTNIEIT